MQDIAAQPTGNLVLLALIVLVALTYIPGTLSLASAAVGRNYPQSFVALAVSQTLHVPSLPSMLTGSPKMYGHMVKTRKKQFEQLKQGGKKKSDAAESKQS